jgi:hypothetical protein
MSGQVHVDLLPVEAIPDALAALTDAGFSLTPVQGPPLSAEKHRC